MKEFEWLDEFYLQDPNEDNSSEENDSQEGLGGQEGQDEGDDNSSQEDSQLGEKNKPAKQKQSAPEKAKQVKDAIDTGKKIGKLSKMLGPLMPVLGYIALIIAILIAAIGLLMFLLTMPGAILDKIKAIVADFGNGLVNAFYGEANNVKRSQVADVGTKLEDMGYDIFAYGFLSDKVKDETYSSNIFGDRTYHTYYLNHELTTANWFGLDQTFDPDMDTLRVTEDGILRDKNGIVMMDSDYISSYLVSDNYVYLIRNNDANFLRTLFAKNGRDGLINLYHEGSGLGYKGNAYDALDSVGGFLRAVFGGHRISISVDRQAKQLVVSTEVNGLWGAKKKFLYNLDGWTGRYGMPLEFLLSLHLSSMQPDLAYDLVAKTNTEIQLVTHESDATVKGGVKLEDGTIADTETLKKKKEEEVNALIDERNELRGYSDLGYYLSLGFVETEYTRQITEEYEQKLTECRAKWDALISKSSKLDVEFKTAIPYIYAVRDHWFRDVYFTDNERSTFVEVDEEYQLRTAERWSKYETVSVSDTGVDTDDYEQVITYGEGGSKYAAERSEYTRGGLGDVQYVLYYYRNGDMNDEVKYMYNGKPGTREDVENDESLTDEQKASILSTLHKKVLTSSFDYAKYDTVDDDYEGKLSGFSDRWVAYTEIKDQDSGWQKYVPDNSGEADGISEAEAENLYYKIILSSAIKQVEDGQRGPTNKKAKEIFSINKYYTYNGTSDRAEAIDEDRYSTNVKNQYLDYKDGKSTSFNTESDPRNPDLIEKFSVSRDSISAFNILTNMNTLDSDAIYHDFKELIVELDFFDKEELTAIPNQTFEWPIPEIGSRGWPMRTYSKYENEYGTSLHSKYVLNFLKGKNAINYSLQGNTITSNSFEAQEYEEGEAGEATGALKTILATESIGQIQGKNTRFLSPFDELAATGDGSVAANVGASVGDTDPSEVSVDEFLESTREMALAMNEMGFNYCVMGSCQCPWEVKVMSQADQDAAGITRCSGVNHCHHHPHPEDHCGLESSWERASDPANKQNVCCATFVSWALGKVGVMKGTVNVAGGLADFIKENYDCEVIEQGGDVQPGDIMVYGRGHICVIGEEEGSGNIQYDGGHSCVAGTQVGQKGSYVEAAQDPWSGNATEAIRLFGLSSSNTEAYRGYKGGELVVSPVTGVVVQAGVTQKQKNIETGLIENVGYVKIRVLDRTDFTAAFGKEGSTEEDLEGFKYFLEEYEDNKVAGDIMYIEGFSLELLRQDGVDSNGLPKFVLNSSDTLYSNMINTKGEIINEYTKREYNEVLNKKTKKKLEEKEEARVNAKAVYESSAGFIIKEGTALGTTYSDHDYETQYQEYLNEMRREMGIDEVPVAGKEPIKSDDPRIGRKITVRPGLTGENGSECLYDAQNLEILKVCGDGNFIRIILRASKDGKDAKTDKDSIIEDVEDYIEIAPRPVNEIEWELFFWTPHESGPADPNGPIAYEDHSGASCVTAGMIQWMSAYSDSGNKNIQYLCKHLGDYDSQIGNSLSFIAEWTNTQIKDDVTGDREIEKAMQTVNTKDHDQFMWAELEVAKAQFLDPLLKKHSWLEKRPKCVQGAIMHIGVHDGHYPSDMDSWDALDDYGVLDKVAAHWNDGNWQYKEPGIARAILDGKLTTDDVEYWVRNKDVQFLLDHGVDYNGTGN